MRSLAKAKPRERKPLRSPTQKALLYGGSGFFAVACAAMGFFALAQFGYVKAATEQVGAWVSDTEKALGFTLAEVTVSGRTQTDADALKQALGVRHGDPMLSFDAQAARARIEGIDWVDKASIRRLWPDVLHIDLQERVPFAIWQRDGEVFLIDRAGGVITGTGLEPFAHLPFVVGRGASEHAGEILGLMQNQPGLRSRVTAYVRVSERRWNLRLENGVDVMLPEHDVARALNEIVTLDASHKLLSRDITAVDLRLTDRIGVRLSEAAQARQTEGSRAGGKALIDGVGVARHRGGSET